MSLVAWDIVLMDWNDFESKEHRNSGQKMTKQDLRSSAFKCVQVRSSAFECVRRVGFDDFHEPLAEYYLLQFMNASSWEYCLRSRTEAPVDACLRVDAYQ